MAPRPRTTFAGGFPIALGALGGTVVGIAQHQPSAGFLVGLGAGILLAIAIWLLDRRR